MNSRQQYALLELEIQLSYFMKKAMLDRRALLLSTGQTFCIIFEGCLHLREMVCIYVSCNAFIALIMLSDWFLSRLPNDIVYLLSVKLYDCDFSMVSCLFSPQLLLRS